MTKQRKTKQTIKSNVRLFNQLMKIADNDTTKFFWKDMTSGMGTKVRIFSYHVASYTDWLQAGALESRGIMFELDENDKPVRVMCRPMAKFFNYQEHNTNLNTLCESLIKNGRLSKDVYEKLKTKGK